MYKSIIVKYFSLFENGETYNYYLDRLRYSSKDTWAIKKDWIFNAKKSIEKNANILQALEILIKEEFDDYYALADRVLSRWYSEGAYDIGAYYDLIFSMPKDYYIRKKIADDYLEYYLTDDSWGYAQLARASLIRNDDKEFCKIYGDYINKFLEKNVNDFNKLELFLESSNIIDFGNRIYDYIDKQNIVNLKNFLFENIKKDKLIANKILNNDSLILEENRSLWIADKIAEISYFLGFFDILDYLLEENWYWMFLFDDEYGYEDNNNSNLLVWSNYSNNSVLKERAESLIKNRNSELDGVIALSRIESLML